MPFSKIIAEIHAKLANILWEQNEGLTSVKEDGVYSYHLALNG
jgi:hypothetical protein